MTESITMTRAAYTDLMARVSAAVQHEGEAYSLLRQVQHGTAEAIADARPIITDWLASYECRRKLTPPVSAPNDNPSATAAL